ncbi:hypothetical protein ACG7TL_003365 [Trametes sanguinea]
MSRLLQSIEDALVACKTGSEAETLGATDFIRAGLRLDLFDRASAAVLEVHAWMLMLDCTQSRATAGS